MPSSADTIISCGVCGDDIKENLYRCKIVESPRKKRTSCFSEYAYPFRSGRRGRTRRTPVVQNQVAKLRALLDKVHL